MTSGNDSESISSSSVDANSPVLSTPPRAFVRSFVGCRQNPLGLPEPSLLQGDFPRYCSRFPTHLRAQLEMRKSKWTCPNGIVSIHNLNRTDAPMMAIRRSPYGLMQSARCLYASDYGVGVKSR